MTEAGAWRSSGRSCPTSTASPLQAPMRATATSSWSASMCTSMRPLEAGARGGQRTCPPNNTRLLTCLMCCRPLRAKSSAHGPGGSLHKLLGCSALVKLPCTLANMPVTAGAWHHGQRALRALRPDLPARQVRSQTLRLVRSPCDPLQRLTSTPAAAQLCVRPDRRRQQLGQGSLHGGRRAHRQRPGRGAQGGRVLRLPSR